MIGKILPFYHGEEQRIQFPVSSIASLAHFILNRALSLVSFAHFVLILALIDGLIMAHLSFAVLACWIVPVTTYRLKLKNYPNELWDEMMRTILAQVVVTAMEEDPDGDRINERQGTKAEEEQVVIYELLGIKTNPIGEIQSRCKVRKQMRSLSA